MEQNRADSKNIKDPSLYIDEYIKTIGNNKYGILLQKCCGYKWLIIVPKHITLLEFYRYVELDLGNGVPFAARGPPNINLYTETKEKIPQSTMLLSKYIVQNQKTIKPVYKLPHPVIYPILVEDHHCTDYCTTAT